MSLGDLGIGSINGGPIGTKNVIINGNFGINQRGVSGTVTLAAGAYGHDRWKAGASGCTYTFATTNNVTTLTISAGSLIQVIEGLNLYSGTYTLSWTGTAQGKIGAGSYAGSGVTGAAVGGTNLNIEFNTGTVSLVQFEQGSVATPFERRPYGTELQLAQRYAMVYGGNTAFEAVGLGIAVSTSVLDTLMALPVSMRATPSITASGSFQASDGTSGSVVTSFAALGSQCGLQQLQYRANTASTMTQFRTYRVETNNSTAARLIFSAEL